MKPLWRLRLQLVCRKAEGANISENLLGLKPRRTERDDLLTEGNSKELPKPSPQNQDPGTRQIHRGKQREQVQILPRFRFAIFDLRFTSLTRRFLSSVVTRDWQALRAVRIFRF